MKITNTFHAPRGSAILELGPALLLLLIFLLIPLIDLSVIGLRTATVFTAAREAARAGGRAATFSNDSGYGLSAKHAAVSRALDAIKGMPAVTIIPSDVSVYLIGTPTVHGSASKPIRQAVPLAAPADTAHYVFEIEVTVKGSVNPLLTLSSSLFGTVPGLTAPLVVVATGREVVEHPEGLNY